MSDPQAPVTQTAAAPVAAPAKPLNAIQLVEQDIVRYIQTKEQAVKQYEQALANVHAVDGAIQATQNLLQRLKAEAAKAVTAVKTEAVKVETDVKSDVAKAEGAIEGAVEKIESKVVSIAEGVKKDV